MRFPAAVAAFGIPVGSHYHGLGQSLGNGGLDDDSFPLKAVVEGVLVIPHEGSRHEKHNPDGQRKGDDQLVPKRARGRLPTGVGIGLFLAIQIVVFNKIVVFPGRDLLPLVGTQAYPGVDVGIETPIVHHHVTDAAAHDDMYVDRSLLCFWCNTFGRVRR